MIQEIEVQTYSGKQKEILNPHKDTLLGERNVLVNYHHVVSYSLYAHVTKNQKIYYIYYFVVIQGQITEYIRIIRKDTVIFMLSRLKLTEEQEFSIKRIIPYFEREKEKIQLFDRTNDYDKLLTDERILKNMNKNQSFSFFGHHVECHRAYPHQPHVTGYYDTVRYGSLPIYCTGRSGTLLLRDGKKVLLLITKKCTEGCWGSYIFFKPKE